MKIFGRQDLLPLAGLAAAILILFSAPLSRVLSYARRVEEDSGLSLVPALVLLAVIFGYHEIRKRHFAHTEASVVEAQRQESERRAEEVERLIAFGQALGRSGDFESIRVSIAQHLPLLAGSERVWVLIREGTQWEALAGDTRGSDEVLKWGDLAEQLLAGQTADGEGNRAIEACTPLLALAIRQAQLTREVRENNVRDALTGCFTRGHAMEVIDAELRRARRSHAPVSLIMFDVDHLKDVNDRHGHLCGDAVLAVIGKRMREVLRGSDLKCRYAGEQFLVLLPETPLQGAKRVAETLRREVADRPVAWAGENLQITASVGLAQALQGEVNVQALIGRADHALYRAKDEGGNCVRIAPDTAASPADAVETDQTSH